MAKIGGDEEKIYLKLWKWIIKIIKQNISQRNNWRQIKNFVVSKELIKN